MNAALLPKVTVPLSVPVIVQAADGKSAERSSLTLTRPKVRHAKRLTVLVGKDMLEALINSDAISDDGKVSKLTKAEGRQLITDLLQNLLSEDRLQGITDLIADLAGEEASVIDDVDLVDLPSIALAFAGFFPALRSAIAGLSAGTSQSSDDTTPAT